MSDAVAALDAAGAVVRGASTSGDVDRQLAGAVEQFARGAP
jgi:hypothetical protein